MWQRLLSLRSTQEEADTRMMIHVKHAATSYQNVVVNSEDTDVFCHSPIPPFTDSYQDPTEKRKRECSKTDRDTTTTDHFRRGCLPGHDRCSLDVILSAPLGDMARSKHLIWSTRAMNIDNCSHHLDKNGMSLKMFFKEFKHSPVTCIVQIQTQNLWTNLGTKCFVLKMVTYLLDSSHHAVMH